MGDGKRHSFDGGGSSKHSHGHCWPALHEVCLCCIPAQRSVGDVLVSLRIYYEVRTRFVAVRVPGSGLAEKSHVKSRVMRALNVNAKS